jgi:hypothetical protein
MHSFPIGLGKAQIRRVATRAHRKLARRGSAGAAVSGAASKVYAHQDCALQTLAPAAGIDRRGGWIIARTAGPACTHCQSRLLSPRYRNSATA